MHVRHPRAHPDVPGKPPAKIDTPDGLRTLDEDHTFGQGEDYARELADRYDVPHEVTDASVPLEDIDLGGESDDTDEEAESGDESDTDDTEGDASSDDTDGEDGDEGGTCEEVKNDGEVCGRDLPCPYHSED